MLYYIGTETRVVADDAQIYMISLLESLEKRRSESFIGWYHSHPFDIESYSHCHLSNTDVLTQTNWQRSSPTWCVIMSYRFTHMCKQPLVEFVLTCCICFNVYYYCLFIL